MHFSLGTGLVHHEPQMAPLAGQGGWWARDCPGEIWRRL